MGIKQQGGIFGRNPTFNNVTVDGILTVDQIVEKTGAAGITLDGVTLKDGNVVLADGKGIDFSATAGTGTSELFDDYEEGTWTATVGCTGNATTTTTVTAYYTKIGRQVTVGFRFLNNIDTTGLSGFFLITGLPYACIAGSTAGFAGIADWSDLTYPASVDTVTPVTSNGASTIVFSARGSGIAGGLLGATQPTSGVTDIAHFALTYFTS